MSTSTMAASRGSGTASYRFLGCSITLKRHPVRTTGVPFFVNSWAQYEGKRPSNRPDGGDANA